MRAPVADPSAMEQRLVMLYGHAVVAHLSAWLRKRCGPCTSLERVRFLGWALDGGTQRTHCGVTRDEVTQAIHAMED